MGRESGGAVGVELPSLGGAAPDPVPQPFPGTSTFFRATHSIQLPACGQERASDASTSCNATTHALLRPSSSALAQPAHHHCCVSMHRLQLDACRHGLAASTESVSL